MRSVAWPCAMYPRDEGAEVAKIRLTTSWSPRAPALEVLQEEEVEGAHRWPYALRVDA